METNKNIYIYHCVFIVEPGRHGYPGTKGQRGDHGANGPNVTDQNHVFFHI